MSDIPINLTGNLTPDEQYLWDATGTPSPVTRAIEAALSTQRFSGRALIVRESQIDRRRWTLLAIAAVLVLTGAVTYLMVRPSPTPAVPKGPQATWTIAALEGTPKVGDSTVMKTTPAMTVTERPVETDQTSRARLNCGTATSVTMDNNTSVRVADGNDRFPWISLEHGSLFASVAPADHAVLVGVMGETVTVKPGTTASISVPEKAAAVIGCKEGQVDIDWTNTQTRLAAPASCTIDPGTGPAVPVPQASSQEFRSSLGKLDELLTVNVKVKDPKAQYSALRDVLSQATRKDAPALWNLLPRVQGDDRVAVRNMLRKLIKAPQGIDPDAILQLEPKAMDAWWNAAVEAAK
jgi:FecR protein